MAQLMALGVNTPQINTVGNFEAAQNNAIQQKGALQDQKAKAYEAVAEHALGVMGGRLDGPVDPTALNEWIGSLPPDDPMAVRLKGHPELVPILAKGSLSVLQAGQDQQKLDLAEKQFQLDLDQYHTKANAARYTEVSPGATLHDTMGSEPDWTAPAKPPDTAFRMMTPDEVKAAGLPEGSYQIDDVNKRVYPIGGTSNGITISNPDGTTTQIGGPAARGPVAYDVADAQRLVKLGGEIADGGRSASSQIATLGKMKDLLGNDKVYSGPGAQQVEQLQRVAVLLGADPKGVASTESINALMKKSVLDLAGGSLGTGFSNGDRDYLDAQVPTLDNTKAGNLLLIGIMEKAAQHKKDIAGFTASYKKDHGGRLDANFDGALADWAEANPVFAEASGAGAPAPHPAPAVGTVDDGYRFKGGDPTDQKNWELVH